jgi:predicted RNA-binding protein
VQREGCKELKWPAKHTAGVDPGLVGPGAFEHPAVREWWRWLREDYTPESSVALVMPCSNVKPYTRSPASRKMRGLLRRLGLWDEERGRPRGVEWLYFSDLLVLVPYWRAEEYPACCYEVSPDTVLGSTRLRGLVASLLAEAVEHLVSRGLREVVVFLPRKHLVLWEEARGRAARWPLERRVRYTLFSFRGVGEALSEALRS